MNEVTSLFDLFNKARTDKRYKELAVLAYQEHIGTDCESFGLAKAWINRWAERRVGREPHMTCEKMVEYINTLIPRVEHQ